MTKTYECGVKISNKYFSITSPTGITIDLPMDRLQHLSEELQEVAIQVGLIGSGVYSLTKEQMLEAKNVKEQDFIPAFSTAIPGDVVDFPRVELKPVHFPLDNKYIESPNHKAVVNIDTEQTYSVVSNRYKKLDHVEGIASIEQVLIENDLTDCERSIYLSDDGGFMECKWNFPAVKEEVVVGDIVSPSLFMRTSYDTSMIFEVAMSAERLACSNGMTVADKLACYRRKHTLGLDLIQMQRVIAQGFDKFKEQVQHWGRWGSIEVNNELINQVKDCFGKKDFEQLRVTQEVSTNESIEKNTFTEVDEEENEILIMKSKLSAWVLLNICTQFITHKIENRKKAIKLNDSISGLFNRL